MELEDLRKKCLECERCKLSKTRKNVVFGEGSATADIMFVGEGPGQTEDETGRPFVGRAGQLLDKYLAAVGLKREEVYIANIVKCRPPSNRDPEDFEADECIRFLREQVRLIRPRFIVCLGRVAACRLISPDFKVGAQHGKIVTKGGIKFMGTYHPSALLRNPSHRPDAYEDFVKLYKEYTSSQNEK